MNNLHVLFIVKAYHHSYNPGTGIYLEQQAIAISKTGIKTGLIAVNFVSWKHLIKTFRFDFGFKKYHNKGINALIYQTPVFPFFKTLNHRRRDKILHKLSKKYIKLFEKPDICHVHGFYCGNEAIRLKKTDNIPFVTTEHYSVFARNMANRREKKIAAHVYAESSERIAVSEEFKELLQHMFKQNFIYIPNIVDIESFSLKQDFTIKNDFRFISIGSLDKNKNHQLLLKAFAQLQRKDCFLTIAGDGPLMNELKTLATNLGINELVHFVGFVSHDKLITLIQESDALVVSSKYETFGIVIIEAISCGIPVISTPVGVANQLLKDENLGYLCSYNPSNMAECLQKIISRQYDRKLLRSIAINNFSEIKIAQKLNTIYMNALKSHN